MKVAIIGKSRFSGILTEQLLKEGLTPVFLENTDEIKSINGEVGEYLIKTQQETIEAGYVIVTEEPSAFDNYEAVQDNGGPVVLLLDDPEESPAYMTETALTKAIQLARKQKKVLYLSKFMRTSGNGIENLYKEARNLGVVFVKYNEVNIHKDNDTGMFRIRVTDDYDELGIYSYVIMKAGETAISPNIGRIAKLLKLKLEEGRYPSGNSYFQSPSITSRKGIYFLQPAAAANLDEELLQQIRFTVSAIRAGTCEQTEYAEVDPGKCAFCYTCYRACPHGAMSPDYENSAMKNLNKACQGCGICVSICPAGAVRIKGRKPGTETVPNTLKVYSCENSGNIALGKIADEVAGIFDKISFSTVSCGGEITAEKIVDGLKYYEKVLYVACMDDACRHHDGNKRARLQIARAKEMLKSAGLDENRIVYMQVSHAMPYVLRDSIMEVLK
jgi:quinone-modifying oxidoreductase, subunit QmoB